MFAVQKVDTLDLPQLAPYRTLRRQEEHRKQGIFVAEGEKVVRRLFESPLEVVSALMPEKWLRNLEPILQARAEMIPVFTAEKKLLESLTGFSMYQGLLAVGKVPSALPLESICAHAKPPTLFVAVDGLSSAENLGALVRSCLAFEVAALLVGETCTSPFLRRAVRSSMGAIFHLPIIESANLPDTLTSLKAAGIQCVAAHPAADDQRIRHTDLTRPTCLVFGSEGYGISSAVLHVCDFAAAIPMPRTVDSLNVASAAAVFLYETNRQRNKV